MDYRENFEFRILNFELFRILNFELNPYRIEHQFEHHNIVVVTAPPGAGKSTILPLELLQGMEGKGKIVMLEPRRIAARQIADRMAETLGESTGKTVGYRMRFENSVSADTRIEVLTEGILTRQLVSDPTLEGVGMVIFDEFHERSLASDVALALTREAQQLVRPDLKILIMSATIDTSFICQRLHAPLVEMHSRTYNIDILHAKEDIPVNSRPSEIAQHVAEAVRTAHSQHEGDILAFLPGQAEIVCCKELLDGRLGSTDILPLYGQLPISQQREAIAPPIPGRRKVVLATPIAETSLTIQGVRVVVDSGLCRKLVFNPQSGLSRLETVRISMDMADQRAGRAGRLSDGVCYRLWTKATELRMDTCRKPEIEDADLASACLDICAWGTSDMRSLSWLTPPPDGNVAHATQLLRSLDAINDEGEITPHGKKLEQLPCHPRMAQMLVMAKGAKLKALAADIAAILEEKDPMQETDGTDINLRIDTLRELRRKKKLQKGWSRIARIAAQYRRIVRVNEDNDIPTPTDAGLLLALAYPERIAAASKEGMGQFTMACGDTAFVEQTDDIAAHDWIAVGSVNARGGRIFLAAPFSPASLTDTTLIDSENGSTGMMVSRDNVSWDHKKGVLIARRERRIGTLIVDAKPIAKVDRQQVTDTICQAVTKYGTSMLNFDSSVQNLQQRVAKVAEWHPELSLPDLSTDAVLKHPADWLPYWLEGADGRLRTTATELRKIDLCAALWSLLTWDQQQQVDALAPTHIKMPSGSRIKVEYRPGAELPVVRVRLQECFGLRETPRVNNGQQPVLMELLSPGFKPVQLTKDLRSFWQNTYFEVRKELRRRYPKHSWPDNPLEAEAVRGVKRE